MIVGIAFCISYGESIALFSTISEGEGNGSAFKAMLAISLLMLGAAVTTLLGLFASFRGFMRRVSLN